MIPLQRLNSIIMEQSVSFRKGEVYREENHGNVKVIRIEAFPETPLRGTIVDVHFINIGFTEAAADREGFVQAIRDVVDTQSGEFDQLSYEALRGGPSYITIGAWLGSQQLALQFMALCEFHDLGEVITPGKLGITGEKADQLAGVGMVMATCKIDGAAV